MTDRRDLRHLRRAEFPRRRAARHRAPARTTGRRCSATGGGAFMNAETRARIARRRRLGLAQGRPRHADAARAQARQPPAAQDREPRGDMRQLMATRDPVYARADVTVHVARHVARRVVQEIVASTRARTRPLPPGSGRPRHDASAARGHRPRPEPDRARAARRARAYDILIGRGLLGRRRRADRRAWRRRRRHRHRRDRGAAIYAALQAELARGRHAHGGRSSVRRARHRRAYASLRGGLRRASSRAHRARRPRGRARRRRRRRPRRLRRRARAARHALRADSDEPAGAGRFLGRRQDRHQFAATARISSAPFTSRASCSPTPRCSTRCPRASSAPAMPRS